MNDADRLRAQKATSTDPARLEREAKRAALLALADRCEREEPSQELSEAIAFSVGWRLKEAIWWRDPASKQWVMGAPCFTSSLDSAVTLCDWALSHASDIGADGLPYVVLFDGTHEAKGVAGRNLALTWCAAALRARAEEVK